MKLFLRIAVCCLLLFTVACVGEVDSTERSSTIAEAESASTPTAVPTSTVVPTPTAESTPTVETISAVETEDAESDSAEQEGVVVIDITKPLPVGDPQRGEELLEVNACSGCHFLGRIGAGPSWKAEIYAGGKGIATRATERWQKAGYTGEATNETEYLVESILMPNAYVIEGYMGGEMPGAFSEILTEQELADIVSYLLEIE